MSNGGEMPTWLYLLTIGLILGTILLVFGMKYFSAVFQARARIANEVEYRAIVEKSVAMQSENLAALSEIRVEISRVVSSVATVEKILQQID